MGKTKKAPLEEPLEKKLWKTADKLRKNMDAAEYKHIVLGLIFLKYISDAFEELYEKLIAQKKDGADPEDKNEYLAEKVFYVPPTARWKWLQGRAKLPTIGKDVDDAMDAIEKDNPSLRGVLPKVFAQEKLDKQSLGGLIDLVGSAALGTKEAKSKDVLGRVYEYFLGEFALAEGKKGGQFYTPSSVVKLLVEMLEPYEGRVFDPCCGSGGMFVQSEKFVEAHHDHYKKNNGKKLALDPKDRISIYGQESNQTTWRLCKMNLAIRGIDSSNVKWNNEGSFLNDAHKDLKTDFIIANPPFNDSDWSGEMLQNDARWSVLGKKLSPPAGNANYAWIQHFLYHLAPTGRAGFVLSKGSLTTNTNNEGDIRKGLVENDLIDCIVNLPTKLFLNTQIPACLWFVRRNKNGGRKGEILFIDARNHGYLLNRKNRELVDRAISSEGVVDIFDAAGIKKPEISILSDEFLQEVKGMKHRNLALELLKKLLNDEIKARTKFNLVKSKALLQMLEDAIKKYQNNLLTTAEIIQELINLAKEIKASDKRAGELNLSEEELAFYDALETNDSAVQVLGDDTLRHIAREIAEKVRTNTSIDWTIKESARAKLMVLVKRTLTKYGYPPDKQQKAIDTVLKQAELLADYWSN